MTIVGPDVGGGAGAVGRGERVHAEGFGAVKWE